MTSILFTVPYEKSYSPEKQPKVKDFFRQFQWKLIGPYLCFRRYTDSKIWIRRAIPERKYDQLDNADQNERFIPLDAVIAEEADSKMYVTFDRIPLSSFLTVKSRGIGQKSKYFKNLLQVTLRNEAYIFALDEELDHESPKEIGYFHGID